MKPFLVATFIAFLLSCLLFTLAGPDPESPVGISISGTTPISSGTSQDDGMRGNFTLNDQSRNVGYLNEVTNHGTRTAADFPFGTGN